MTDFHNPSIYIFGLRVDEPISSFTDLIVAGVGIMGFLNTRSEGALKQIHYYRYFFLLTGLSTFFSGIVGHAFNYEFGTHGKIFGWLFGILGVGFAQLAVLYNTRSLLNQSLFKTLLYFNYAEIILALVSVFVFRSFVVIEIHSAFGLVIMVTVLEAINYSKTRSTLSKNMVWGVALAVAAVICHISQLDLSIWFNRADISHMFMASSLYVMYRGVKFELQTLNYSYNDNTTSAAQS